MDKTNIKVKYITRTALLLALTIIFQMLGRNIKLGPNSNFIVGPLVNACLLIATSAVGLQGGCIVSIFSPFGAIITGASMPLPFIPFIAAGNLLLVLCFYFATKNMAFKPFLKKAGPYVGILAGSVLKFIFLYVSILIFLSFYAVPSKQGETMLFIFSWPQLVTALTGGAIALVVINVLKKNKIIQTE